MSARGGGALFEPDTWEPKPALWRWAFVPYPTAVPGELLDWQWEPATGRLAIEYTSDGEHPAVLVAPALWYPDGPRVEVSGGQVEVGGGRVVHTPAGPGRHTVVLF